MAEKIIVHRKVCGSAELSVLSERYHGQRRRIVLCHGCFDLVHPGHLRYLKFARQQGDVLVVSLTGDDAIEKSDGTRPYIPQELRAESLAAIELVDHVVISDSPTAEPIIRSLHPDVYIKGKEYEGSDQPGFLSEKELVQAQGGRVIYSSGQVVFSSSDLIENLGHHLDPGGLHERDRLAACCRRWDINSDSLCRLVLDAFKSKRIAVIGDAILDRYVFCDSIGPACEAPILSVRPLQQIDYLGGAAIIASHLKAMGAEPHLITTIGPDRASAKLLARLRAESIATTLLKTRRRLPVKRRYLVDTQKLLKVDRGECQPLDSALERRLLKSLAGLLGDLDAVILVDFGFGTLTGSLLNQLLPMVRPRVGIIAGDISGPRRSLLSLHGADLLTPNERELRSVIGDFESSLPTVAMSLMKSLRVANLAVTMGPRGCLLFKPREDDADRSRWFRSRLRSDYLPSLCRHGVDPLGGGDAFLAASTLAMTAGATLPQAGYIGSASAAMAVSRVGNLPVCQSDLLPWLRSRQEIPAAPPPETITTLQPTDYPAHSPSPTVRSSSRHDCVPTPTH